MKVKKAWYLNGLPRHVVVETEEGKRVMFRDAPFRTVKPDEMQDYKGHDPETCAGYPLEKYIYRHYGLEQV